MHSPSRCAWCEHAIVERGGADLAPWERWRLVRHLNGCPACRHVFDRMLAIEAAVADLPEEPLPTPEQAVERIEAAARLAPPPRATAATHPWLGRLLTAAGTLIVIFLAAQTRDTSVLHADAVIASVRELERSDLQRARVVVAPVAFGQPAIVTIEVDDGRPQTAGVETPEVTRLLRRLGIDRTHPLAMQPFRDWRASLRAPRDEVTRLHDGSIRLRTWAETTSPVRLGEIQVAGERPRITRVVFVLDDLRLDVEETAYRPMPPADAVTVTGLLPDRLERAEMAARVALHETGADLARDVTVSRAPTAVRVAGSVSPAQRAALVSRLAAISDVEAAVTARATPAPPEPALAGWRARVFSDAAKGQAFVADLHSRVRRIAAHGSVLAQLDARYPASALRQLPPDVRAQFQAIVTGHYRAMRAEGREIRPPLAVLAGAEFSVISGEARDRLPSDWRHRVAQTAAPAHEIERLVEALLRRHDLSRNEQDDERVGLRRAYADLRAALP